MMTTKTAALITGAALLLAACGGGSDDPAVMPPPPVVATAVPGSAVASPTALVGYLSALKAGDETSEPLALPTMDLASSETEEAQPL